MLGLLWASLKAQFLLDVTGPGGSKEAGFPPLFLCVEVVFFEGACV